MRLIQEIIKKQEIDSGINSKSGEVTQLIIFLSNENQFNPDSKTWEK